MGYRYRWKPSQEKRRIFAERMRAIEEFIELKGIDASRSKDSYYFEIRGEAYRVSNHSVEASNARAYDRDGNRVRAEYHPGGRIKGVHYIFASKTRLIEIYNDLEAGWVLDGNGRRVRKAEAAQLRLAV